MTKEFSERLEALNQDQKDLLILDNQKSELGNGIFDRWERPVLTSAHVPIDWRYDLNPKTNPHLMERLGINAVFNSGAIKWQDKYVLIARVEGWDRKSFFALAESPNGVDHFGFTRIVDLAETAEPDTNVYDMRLTQHEDGYIYGLFCTERKDPSAGPGDTSSAVAQCGIVRTTDMNSWERLPDLVTPSPQQRNVVLHPKFVDGEYGLYTRPQDSFIEAGRGGGIGWATCSSMEKAEVEKEVTIDPKIYHTIKELKNGQGPPPLETEDGWLHLAHGVRNTAAGLRYVLYMFLTDLEAPTKVIHRPSGYFLAPENDERIGDVSNVAFSNGWIMDDDGTVYIYYGSSDTRMHVATSSIDRLLDYVKNTPEDGLRSAESVAQRLHLIRRNSELQ